MPDFTIEDEYQGFVCGIDEAGRGPLAGPVVAACVHIPEDIRDLLWISEIKDSKKIPKPKLAKLYKLILEQCSVGIGQCSPDEIDDLNILWASMLAMERAFEDMPQNINFTALIDGNRIPKNLPYQAQAVVKGDQLSTSIAAASIIAKVTRDNIMQQLSINYPQYGWGQNAAYPTKQHLDAIERHGITPHHRKSFGPVRKYLEQTRVSSAA